MNHNKDVSIKKASSEKGQAIVLIVLALVAVFGFAALAVDGGRLYSERRRAQNAADSAAYAAASAKGGGQTTSASVAAAINLAAANGFNNDGTTNSVTVSNPPVSGVYGPGSGLPSSERNKYFQVTISQHVDPIFSQLFFGGAEQVTVEAVSRVEGFSAFTGTNALVSLDTTAGEAGMEFDGNITLIIHGGNVWSNNDGIKNGNSGSSKVFLSLHDDSVTGNIFYVGDWPAGKRDKITANFVQVPTVMSVPNIPAPYCPSGSAPKTETWNGVTYYLRNGGSLPSTLTPGVWCIKGELNSNTVGNGVLVVLLDGGVKYTGGGNLQLTRANDLVDKNGNQWGGMVIYAPLSNTNRFRFGGNSKSLFNGTVFAPGMDCDFGGTPDNTSNHTAMICNTVKIHGNPIVDITYKAEENYRFAPSLDLVQ